MADDNAGRLNVPDELRDTLLDFTVGYLLEHPSDIIDYGIEFFDKLKKTESSALAKRYTDDFSNDDDDDDDDDGSDIIAPPTRYYPRRKPIFAETYNPEEDTETDGPPVVFLKSDEQRRALATSVKNIFIFRALDSGQINTVIDAMFEREVRTGDDIIKQGDDGDNFYVIARGTFAVYITGADGDSSLVCTFKDAGSFGELALLYNTPRQATVRAKTDGLLWAVDRRVFRRIVLKSAFKKRKMYEKLIAVVPMLKPLQLYERVNLTDALVPRYYRNDECIISQGDPGDGMYFVEEGAVDVYVANETDEQIKINRIGKGGYFGELALIAHKGRAASVFAVDNVKLAFLDVDAFERLLGPCMNIMKRNIADYDKELANIFGAKRHIT